MDSDLSELLESDVGTATNAAYGVRKDDYSRLVAFGNVTSFSMEQVLHACARKFQLLKLGAAADTERVRESNPTFAFGHAVGAGVATYDATRDLGKAMLSDTPKEAKLWGLGLVSTLVSSQLIERATSSPSNGRRVKS